MAMTIALSTALSGLTTAQQALDVVSQNISNVNTPGYTREVANQQPVTLNGQGAGVQLGQVTRPVNVQMLRTLRDQNSTVGQLTDQQGYFQQIENLFGQVGDSSSIAATLGNLTASFNALSTNVNDSSQRFGTVQSAVSTTNQLNTMSGTLQDLRIQADAQISSAVNTVNADLTNISKLNSQIVDALATGTDAASLQDQRDSAITDLSNYMNVTYFQEGNGATNVYTGTGQVLVDTSQLNLLSHPSTSVTDASMTKAAGDFAPISIGPTAIDLTNSISSGKLAALVGMRDTTIPNLQSELDQVARQLQTSINQASNRGTTQPTLSNSYSGTRTFATQGSITPESGDSGVTLTSGQGLQSLTSAAYGSLSFSYSTTSGQITISGATAGSLATLKPGTTFTVTGSAGGGANDGTYTVTGYDATTNTLTVNSANPVQTFSMPGGADTAISIFDANGTQLSTTTLNTVMTTDYRGQNGLSASDPQAANQAAGGPWSVDSFSKHMQAWLQSQGYSSAKVGLDSSGHMQITLGSATQATIAFRDQVSGTAGATAQDATINFDANGDGATDQTVQGFANFFGLNDVFVDPKQDTVMQSGIQPANFTVPATTPQRAITFYDTSGQLGNSITVPAGSTLQDVADLINTKTQTVDSAAQGSTTYNLAGAATFTVYDANGVVESQSFGPGQVSLKDMAARLTTGTVTAQVVQSSSGAQLRLFDSRGVPLTTTIEGGTLLGSTSATLSSQLDMNQANHLVATVIPEGSGERLQVVQTGGKTIFAGANQDATGGSLTKDLGMGYATTGASANLTVRADMQGDPSRLPGGAVQWNADLGQYYLSEGDNTTALQMAAAMAAPNATPAAGNIGVGNYTLSDYAAESISLVAQASNSVTSQQTYQTTLQSSLKYQYTQTTGVNLDEEVSNMMNYQQAYTASARVITTISGMLSQLMDIIK